MRRWHRWTVGVLGAFVVLLVGAMAAWWWLFDADAYRDDLIAAVERATGRDFIIAGALQVQPGPQPTLAARSVTLGNAVWGESDALLIVERVVTRIALLPLVRGEVVLERILLDGVTVNLETHPEHGGNWRLQPDARPHPDVEDDGWRVRFPRHVRITDARLAHQPTDGEPAHAAAIRRLDLRAPGAAAPLTLALKARYRTQDLTAEVRADPWQELASGAGSYRIHDLQIRLGDSDLGGDGAIAFDGPRPRLDAEFDAEYLDLRVFQGAREKSADDRLFPEQPFEFGWLRLADADMRLQAGRVITNGLALDNLEAGLTLDDGHARLNPLTADLAGGRLTGDVALDAGATPPLLSVELTARGVRPGRLPAFADGDLVRDAPSDLELRGEGRGRSPAAIAGQFNGSLRLAVGSGSLRNNTASVIGADVLFSTLRLVNPLADRETRSELVCGALNLDISDGVARGEKGIALQTDKVNVLGNAVIDLASEAIAIRVKPTAREGIGINLGTLSGGFSVGGTLTDPTPTTGDVKDKLLAAGRIGAAVATGGLSLVAEGAFDRSFASDDPCSVVLSDAGKRQSADPGVIDKTTDKARELFEDLFGQ